jgi:hypothetical protein
LFSRGLTEPQVPPPLLLLIGAVDVVAMASACPTIVSDATVSDREEGLAAAAAWDEQVS